MANFSSPQEVILEEIFDLAKELIVDARPEWEKLLDELPMIHAGVEKGNADERGYSIRYDWYLSHTEVSSVFWATVHGICRTVGVRWRAVGVAQRIPAGFARGFQFEVTRAQRQHAMELLRVHRQRIR